MICRKWILLSVCIVWQKYISTRLAIWVNVNNIQNIFLFSPHHSIPHIHTHMHLYPTYNSSCLFHVGFVVTRLVNVSPRQAWLITKPFKCRFYSKSSHSKFLSFWTLCTLPPSSPQKIIYVSRVKFVNCVIHFSPLAWKKKKKIVEK